MAFLPDTALDYVEKAWRENRLAHAYLVSGVDAAGRLRFAERLIRSVNRSDADSLDAMAPEGVHLVQPESKSRSIVIDQIRALEHVIHQRAVAGKQKVGVVVDADRMNQAATNAFLKTLEEPPAGSLLLLLTASPSLLLDTVLSRCIRVPLYQPTSGPPERSEPESQLLAALAAHFSRELTPAAALALVRLHTALLGRAKEEIASAAESDRKKEASHYEKTTGADKWLRDREDHFDALASANYLLHRATMLGVLTRWIGDILRVQAGHPHLDFPEYTTVLQLAARKHPAADLLKRLECLEDLQRFYETNVSEALATELCFLGAFG